MGEEDIIINGKLIKDMKVAELKKACKNRNIPLGGNKATLIKRLKAVCSWLDNGKSSLKSSRLRRNYTIKKLNFLFNFKYFLFEKVNMVLNNTNCVQQYSSVVILLT